VEPVDIRIAEHFALHSARTLAELCSALRNGLQLPTFVYGSENETKWGTLLHDGLEYNVSRPYDAGTLQQWDPSVLPDCNVGLTLSIASSRAHPKDAAQSSAEFVPLVGQTLADVLGVQVHHHRTWLGPGNSIASARRFNPRLNSNA